MEDEKSIIHKSFDEMNQSEKKITIIAVIFSLIFFTTLGVIFYFERQPIVFKQPEKAVGVCNRIWGRSRTGYSMEVLFWVNKKKYYYDMGYDGNHVVNEKFMVEYEKSDPTINRVVEAEPVYLVGEEVKLTRAKVIRLYQNESSSRNNNNKIDFEYYVNGKLYTKYQEVKKKDKYKVGKYYYLEYWVPNPQRSIIYFEEYK